MANLTIEYNENLMVCKIRLDLGMLTDVYTYDDASKKAKSIAADIMGPLHLTNYYVIIDFKYCFKPQSAQTTFRAADFE